MSNHAAIDTLVGAMLSMSRDYTVSRLSTGEYGLAAIESALRRLSGVAECDHGRCDIVGDVRSLRESERKLHDLGRSIAVGGRNSCNYERDGRFVSLNGCNCRSDDLHGGFGRGATSVVGGGFVVEEELGASVNVGNIGTNGSKIGDELNSVSEHGDPSGIGRGVNWERNQQWKHQRKLRKEKKKAMQGNWRHDSRVKTPVESVSGARRGYFADCSEDVQRQLRETRAAALVEENKVKVMKAKRVLDQAASVTDQMRLAESMIYVAKLANRLTKTTADRKIGGWAQTVADSLTKSVAESAPSSIPSLESVGFGKSGLKSSDGSFVSSERIQEYQSKVKILEAEFESHGLYQTYEEDLFMLKQEYGDVALPPEERYKDKYDSELTVKFLKAGVSPMVIDEVLGTGVFSNKY